MTNAEKENRRLMKKSNKRGMGWFNGYHPHSNNDDLELTKGGYVNLDAGNVPIGIAAFNNSTGNSSSNSSMSVAEALFDLSNNECYNIDEAKSRPKKLKGERKNKEPQIKLNREVRNHLEPIPSDYTIKTLSMFDQDAEALGITKDDVKELKQFVKQRQPKADIGGRILKYEWTPSRLNTAKGEYRVFCIEVMKSKSAYLYNIYLKKKQSDIDDKEKESLRRIAKFLREQ